MFVFASGWAGFDSNRAGWPTLSALVLQQPRAGWPTLSALVLPQPRVPHPLRFSKGGSLGRLRHGVVFSFSVLNFTLLKSLRRSLIPAGNHHPSNTPSAGWPTLSALVQPQPRVPHPLRFSKGGSLERLRHETFPVSASSTSYFLNHPSMERVARVH